MIDTKNKRSFNVPPSNGAREGKSFHTNKVYRGNCLEVMKGIPDNYVDTIITDPPAGIGFMGKEWDKDKGGRQQWISWFAEIMEEAKRCLKPGGAALVWALPRTSHWTATALEDAGFVIKDVVHHIFGEGFPKSTCIGSQIDKKGGDPLSFLEFAKELGKAIKKSNYNFSDIDRILGVKSSSCYWVRGDYRGKLPPQKHWIKLKKLLNLDKDLEQLYNEAEREIIGQKNTNLTVYQKIAEKNQSGNINITVPATEEAKTWDGWRSHGLKPACEHWILCHKPNDGTYAQNALKWGVSGLNIEGGRIDLNGQKKTSGGCKNTGGVTNFRGTKVDNSVGRYPSNLILDDSEVVHKEFPETKRIEKRKQKKAGKVKSNTFKELNQGKSTPCYQDQGSAARYFYQCKPSPSERQYGIPEDKRNTHPTLKSIALMEYLCKLTETPTKGIVLDPFAGSGTTGIAAIRMGRQYILIEQEEEYFEIAKARTEYAKKDHAKATLQGKEYNDLVKKDPLQQLKLEL